MTQSNNDPGYGKEIPSNTKPGYGGVAAAAQADANGDGIPDAQQLSDHEQRLRTLEIKVGHINLNTDIFGAFQVVSVIPTGTPKNIYEQIKVYTNSTTYRLYWYDNVGNAWHYATGV